MPERALLVGDVAVALRAVRSVLRAPELTPVPTAPAVVLGLANVRGQVVPVLDGGLLLATDGRAPAALGEAAYVVVVDTAAGPLGLAVSAMPVPADVAVDDPRLVDPDSLVDR
ncbi:MAG: purine-binding chemotaxis protein CheW [Acidimicrobiaceae bacterium]|nr:purine-binding chemotaxis protein CheW [Acidimicrobiaceae bacterium]